MTTIFTIISITAITAIVFDVWPGREIEELPEHKLFWPPASIEHENVVESVMSKVRAKRTRRQLKQEEEK